MGLERTILVLKNLPKAVGIEYYLSYVAKWFLLFYD